MQIQRCLVIRIRELPVGLNDPPVYFILRMQKMDIAGRRNGLSEFFSQRDDPPVDIPKILNGRGAVLVITQQITVVADRLNL